MKSLLIAFVLFLFQATCVQGGTVIVEDDLGGIVRDYSARWVMYRDSGTEVVIAGTCMSACTRFMSLPHVCALPNAYFYFHAITVNGKVDREGSIADSKQWELPSAVKLQYRYGVFSYGFVDKRPAEFRRMAPDVYKYWHSTHGPQSNEGPFQIFLKVKATKLIPACHSQP